MSAALLAGCSSLFKEPPGISYAKSVEQLGIFPVYPPREDIQVGDMYGAELGSKSDRARLHTVYVHSLNMTDDVKSYLANRYKFGNTAPISDGAIKGTTSATLPSQLDAPSDGNVFDKQDMQALPITGFPAIEVDSGLSVGVAGAPQQLAAVFGFAAAKTLKMTLHFGLVTSYSVPIPVALGRLTKYCRYDVSDPPRETVPAECQTDQLVYYINQKYQLSDKDKDQAKDASVLLVSKVYLARAISYTFNDQSMAAAAAAVAGPKAGAKAPTIDGNLLSQAVESDNAKMVQALASFQKSLTDTVVSNQGKEGSTVTIAGYNANSVTFEEIFQRPVVVGYEAVQVHGRSWNKKGKLIR